MIIVKFPTPRFTDENKRIEMVMMLKQIFNPDNKSFCRSPPFKPNDNDDYFVIDAGNDWGVVFFKDDPTSMKFNHRYFNEEAIHAISAWIAFRMGGIVIDDYCCDLKVPSLEEMRDLLNGGNQDAVEKAETFKWGDHVRKKKGSEWQGHVCGWYKTELNQDGICVESESHKGSVQIYPSGMLELVTPPPETL